MYTVNIINIASSRIALGIVIVLQRRHTCDCFWLFVTVHEIGVGFFCCAIVNGYESKLGLTANNNNNN